MNINMHRIESIKANEIRPISTGFVRRIEIICEHGELHELVLFSETKESLEIL